MRSSVRSFVVPQRRYHYCHRRPYVVAVVAAALLVVLDVDGDDFIPERREGERGADVTNILVRARSQNALGVGWEEYILSGNVLQNRF